MKLLTIDQIEEDQWYYLLFKNYKTNTLGYYSYSGTSLLDHFKYQHQKQIRLYSYKHYGGSMTVKLQNIRFIHNLEQGASGLLTRLYGTPILPSGTEVTEDTHPELFI